MPNYRYGKIYQIGCHTTNKIYIGSTRRPLYTRLLEHDTDFQYKRNPNKYLTSFEILKHNNYTMNLVETYPGSTKQELHGREKFHILNNGCVLVNKMMPLCSPHECRRAKINETKHITQNITRHPRARKQANAQLSNTRAVRKVRLRVDMKTACATTTPTDTVIV